MFCLSRLSLRVSVSREQEIEPSVEPWQRGEVKTDAGARRAGSSEGCELGKSKTRRSRKGNIDLYFHLSFPVSCQVLGFILDEKVEED